MPLGKLGSQAIFQTMHECQPQGQARFDLPQSVVADCISLKNFSLGMLLTLAQKITRKYLFDGFHVSPLVDQL
jgi:hypothetical protein